MRFTIDLNVFDTIPKIVNKLRKLGISVRVDPDVGFGGKMTVIDNHKFRNIHFTQTKNILEIEADDYKSYEILQ